MSLIRQSLVAALGSLCGSVGRFLVIAILARKMGSAELGRFLYAQWLVDLGFLVASLGANASAGRYLAEYSAEPPRMAAFLRRWASWALLLPLAASALSVLGAVASRLPLTPAGYLSLACWAVGNGWWTMQTATLVGYQRFDRMLLVGVVNLAVTLSAVLLVPTGSATPGILFAAMALGALLSACAGLGLHRRILAGAAGCITQELPWRGILQFSFNAWLTALLGALVWSRGELPLVRHYLGDAGVAHYAVTLALFSAAIQGITLWAGGIAPRLTALCGQGREGEALDIARRFSDLQLLLSCAAALALFALTPLLLTRLLGPGFQVAAPLLALLLPGLVAQSASAPNHLLQIQTGGVFTRNLSLAGLVLLYLGCLFAIPALGLRGAPLVRSIVLLGMYAGAWLAAGRRWGHGVLSSKNSLAALLPVLACSLWMMAVPSGHLSRAALALVGFVIAATLIREPEGGLVLARLARALHGVGKATS